MIGIDLIDLILLLLSGLLAAALLLAGLLTGVLVLLSRLVLLLLIVHMDHPWLLS